MVIYVKTDLHLDTLCIAKMAHTFQHTTYYEHALESGADQDF